MYMFWVCTGFKWHWNLYEKASFGSPLGTYAGHTEHEYILLEGI